MKWSIAIQFKIHTLFIWKYPSQLFFVPFEIQNSGYHKPSNTFTFDILNMDILNIIIDFIKLSTAYCELHGSPYFIINNFCDPDGWYNLLSYYLIFFFECVQCRNIRVGRKHESQIIYHEWVWIWSAIQMEYMMMTQSTSLSSNIVSWSTLSTQ